MIDRKTLTRALGHQDLADWVIVERDQELAVVDDHVRREERRTRWQLTVHADTPGGRGSAHVTIDANEGDPDRLVEQAATLARLSVGPAWSTIPQAAPARVELVDPALASAELLTAADTILTLVPRRPGATISPRVSVLHEQVTMATKAGFHAAWSATLARVEAVVIANDHTLQIFREARRTDRLDLVAAVDDAIADLRLIASAGSPVGGPCALVLTGDAMLHGGLGVWQAFVSQADAVVARQGLTRYHEHTPIVPGADQLPEPLDITSDGALPFGVRSAPLGDDGDAIRQFPLVAHGIAAGLGLSPREAALRQREPNGGVRNLVVGRGTWDERLPVATRVIEVRRLRNLEIDPYTGDADLELGLGIDHGTPFAGGTLRLDLIDTLARAHRSVRRLQRGPYDGPAAVLIERVDLII
ncbi:MAG: metallopeptidase TldD-related protein [Kofleriaceae bacterium]